VLKLNGIQKVRGSNPLSSTKRKLSETLEVPECLRLRDFSLPLPHYSPYYMVMRSLVPDLTPCRSARSRISNQAFMCSNTASTTALASF
jgi:hypothetical protein